MMNNYVIALLIFVIGYNAIILIYSIAVGVKDLSKKHRRTPKWIYEAPKPVKYSVTYNYIYDGTKWLNEIEVEYLKTIISNKKDKEGDRLSCGCMSPEEAKKRYGPTPEESK